MKKIKNLTGVIAGSQFKYDLVSKARVVEALVNKKISIENAAKSTRTKKSTLKHWYNRYKDCYEGFLGLPAGVMVVYKYAFHDEAIDQAIDLMEAHFEESLKLKHEIGTRTQFNCTGGVDWNAAS